MARLTPPLGAFGKYTLKAPWTTVDKIAYKCVSLRRVEEIVKSGKDIHDTFYRPMGLELSVANEDILKGVVFVGLLGTDGSRIYVPDTYIEGYPDQTAITYDYTVMSVDLGPQPSDMDLTALIDEFKFITRDHTGIDVDDIIVHIGRAQSNTMLTQEQYIAAADARELKKKNTVPTSIQLQEKDERIRQQDALITELLTQIENLKK